MFKTKRYFVTMLDEGDNSSNKVQLGLSGTELVLSRRFCMFSSHVIDGADKTVLGSFSSKKISSLVLDTLAHASYKRVGMYITVSENTVNIWHWDMDLVGRNTAVPLRHAVPETLFHAPIENGRCIRSCLEGFEGQYWKNGNLVASRWWAHKPQAYDWSIFLRASGAQETGDAGELPEQIGIGYREEIVPQKNCLPFNDKLKLLNVETYLYVASAFLSIVACFYAVKNVFLEIDYIHAQKELAELNTVTAEKKIQREQVLLQQRDLITYASILSNVEPVSGIQLVITEIIKIGADIETISTSEDQLDAIFSIKSDFNQRDLISVLEGSDFLKDVSVSKEGLSSRWSITATISQMEELEL